MLIELAHEAGLRPKLVAGTHGGEYATFCPACGGDDRFRIWPNKRANNCIGGYWCRKCGTGGDSLEFCRKFLGYSFAEAKERVNATIPENSTPSFLRKNSLRKGGAGFFKPIVIKSQDDKWNLQAGEFVKKAHDAIWSNTEVLQFLEKRGLPEEAIKKYKIGWNLRDLFYYRTDWGLENVEGKSNKIWLPKGIVIPSLDQDGVVTRLKIRRQDWIEGDKVGKYIIVPGGKNGLNIVGDRIKKVMLIVESELDALAVCHAAGDFLFVVAVGGSTKSPDNITDFLAKQKDITLLVCPDNDEGGAKLLEKWQKLYPHAKPYPVPVGKDIGEAIKQGFDIRTWLLKFNQDIKWCKEDAELTNWILDYINNRFVTRLAYTKLEDEILLGPGSPRAISGELQDGLRLMRSLIETEIAKEA